MVEPLFFSASRPKVGDTFTLDGEEGHHAASVRRMRVGEAIAITDGKGFRARGVVSAVAPKSLEVEIRETQQLDAPKIRFHLVQALAKGDRDEMAVQAATELGLAEITPWQAERSVSRWDTAKAAKNVARWQSIAVEAAKQSLRPFFPVVNEPQTTKQLVHSLTGTVLVLDPTAERSIASVSSDSQSIALVVGPEGGISASELEVLEAAGAIRVHLGEGILRTSTAGVAAIAYLAGSNGLWG
jgi:16S rRNA (uracil1498-N3)-methyltransferase